MYLKNFLKVLVVVICSMGGVAYAEESMAPKMFNIGVFEIAPGMEGAFEEVSAKFKAAADQVESFPDYIVFSNAIGNSGQYAFGSEFGSFGELAIQRRLFAEVYEPEEVERLVGLIQKSVKSTNNFIVVQRLDLSNPAPDSDTPPEIVLSIGIEVDRNKIEQFEDYLKSVVEATKATDPATTWTTYQPGLGARGLWSVRVGMKWTDLDSQPKPILQRLVEHFGSRKGEKIFASGQDAINNLESNVERVRIDLSHLSAAN